MVDDSQGIPAEAGHSLPVGRFLLPCQGCQVPDIRYDDKGNRVDVWVWSRDQQARTVFLAKRRG